MVQTTVGQGREGPFFVSRRKEAENVQPAERKAISVQRAE
jgi:hypothetical protein